MVWILVSADIEGGTGEISTVIDGETVTVPVVREGEDWGWMPQEGHALEGQAIDDVDFPSWDMFGVPPVGSVVSVEA